MAEKDYLTERIKYFSDRLETFLCVSHCYWRRNS